MNEEQKRLDGRKEKKENWRLWGPYLAERAWATVREDYSADGAAWEHFSHDQARRRAYRWNEDGLGGICDEKQYLCLALALWNGIIIEEIPGEEGLVGRSRHPGPIADMIAGLVGATMLAGGAIWRTMISI